MQSTANDLQAAPADQTVFRREGEYWTIAYDGVVIRLKDVKGLQHLATLLQQPGTTLSAVELHAATRTGHNRSAAAGDPSAAAVAERARLTVTKAIKAALTKICERHAALGAHLSATIRRGYFCSYTPDPRHPIHWEM